MIAVDLDGTIRSWQTNEPLEGARDAISKLREQGCRILIHSCNDPKFIEKWMNDHDIRYDYIWTDKGKPVCDCYIDDLGVGFRGNWSQTLEEVNEQIKGLGLA